MSGLVLSLFGGLGLLDRAAELEGFTVVRGPDLLWGQDIRGWHAPAGRFDGVIGGPPCQSFSRLRHLNPHAGEKHGDQIPEFCRVVGEAEPLWFLMENVPEAPEPVVPGYYVDSVILNNRWLGEVQDRTRRFSFGARYPVKLLIEIAALMPCEYAQAVTSSSRAVPVKIGGSGKVKRTYTPDGKRRGPSCGARESVAHMLALQGAPSDLLGESPFTESAKRKMIGNGVPVPMGRAVFQAINRALEVPA